MRDKDADAIVGELLPVTSSVIATAADTPRALPANDLAARIRAMDAARSVIVCPDMADALRRAWDTSPTVCVAGSIFLVGAVRDRVLREGVGT